VKQYFGDIMMFFLWLLACGEKVESATTEETTIADPSLFAQSCNTDTDCLIVLAGDVCSCGCDYAAISSYEERPWIEYYGSIFSLCIPEQVPDCAACPPAEAYCENGTCEAREEMSE
jgi:hypothetical protein